MRVGPRRPLVPLAVTIAATLALVPAATATDAGVGTSQLDTEAACPADRVPDGGFGDTGPPHAASVDCLAWYGIAQGTGPGVFAPREPVLRGQVASIAYRMMSQLDGVTLPRPDPSFSDVRGGAHQLGIETLASFDPPVLQGFGDGTYAPYASITRGQFSSVMVRVLDEVADQAAAYDRLDDADDGFDDTFDDTAPAVHRTTIARLHAAGIVNGYPDGTFRATEDISREQVASMVVRAMAGLVDAGLLDPPDTTPDPDPDPDLGVEVTLTEVASMSSPTAGDTGPDGVLYLAERAGTLHPLTDDGVGDAVLDISALTTTDSERGLLGVAFSADGTQLYLSYTDLDGDTVIDAVEVTDGIVEADERRTVFTQDQPFANHNGGDIHVGPDGMLYLGLGDGGGGGDPIEAGQDLGTALGAMIRIDPQGGDPYAIPADNPFVGQDGVVEEIWAYGLRNPWRFSFDRQTGDLWIADVGQSTREEINRVPAGQGAGFNFGWNLMEGTLEFEGGPEPDDHVPPIYEYETRGPEGCSITGGYVYRGAAIADLVGAYLYSDYCEGAIRGLTVVDGEVTGQADLGIDGGSVVSFAEDADGELYVLDLGGRVGRIDPA